MRCILGNGLARKEMARVFKNGLMEPNTTVSPFPLPNSHFTGEWKNNKAEGKGVFKHVDGDIFDGEWKEDKANGYGEYKHKNGALYKGYWKDDL
jgi:hypothetical protein